jgi:hypothetical protein
MCCGEKAIEEGQKNDVLEKAMKALVSISPEIINKPDEIMKQLQTTEFAKQLLGPEIMKRPDWPVLWCRLICWIKYIICVYQCSPYLRDVLIKSVGKVESVNPQDNSSPIAISGVETPVGGNISIDGSANISGAGRSIKKYSIWYIRNPTANTWVDAPPDNDPLPAAWTGPQYNIDYSQYGLTYTCLWQFSNIILNGTLTKEWTKHTCTFSNQPYWTPEDKRWVTGSLNGMFTILLMIEDNSGGIFYDSQRIWIDNQKVNGIIAGIKGVKHCQDLKLSMGKVNVEGIAYDPLIDNNLPKAYPNDNFNYFILRFKKQNALNYSDIPPGAISTAIGPNIGVLTNWDLPMLDAQTNPLHLPKDQLLARGEACPYDLWLGVFDKTQINDSTDVNHTWDSWPVKIVNDLGE